MEGIGIGMAYSFILLARFLSMPADAVLGRTVPNEFHDLAHHPEAKPVPGVVIYRFAVPLFFMNCTQFRRRVEALADAEAKLSAVVIDAVAIGGVDLAACELLVELQAQLAERGVRLLIANMRTHARAQLARGWPESTLMNLHYPSVGAAVASVEAPVPVEVAVPRPVSG